MGGLVSRLSELKIHPELVPQLIISQLNLWYCKGIFVHLFYKVRTSVTPSTARSWCEEEMEVDGGC